MKKSDIKLLILSMPRTSKRIIVIFVDIFLAIFAVFFAFYLRIGNFIPLWERVNEHYALPACILAVVTFFPIFVIFKLYKAIFRLSGTQTLLIVIKAIALYSIIYSTIISVISIDGVPRTIGIIQPIVFMLLIIFSRFVAWFLLGDIYTNHWKKNKKIRALIFSAGIEGRELMMALSNNAEMNIVGFLDYDPQLHGNQINGLDVYNPSDLKKIIAKEHIKEILLVLKHINRRRRNDILNSLKGENIVIRTLPSYTDLAQGRVTEDNINDLSIGDILGREPVKPDLKLMRHDITDKIVMVTGAGGSIGSEICRQIYNQKPKKLVLFDHSEISLYNIAEELKKLNTTNHTHVEILERLGSVTDKTLVHHLLKEVKPVTIFHAAAYKHVPLVEINKFEGLKNNVFGTLVLAQEAIAFDVKKFVLISSDKAVRPTNIMGASKRVAEMVVQAISTTQNRTNFAIVRFGNVLDSSGSVVPLFKSQIKSGGPITVTHSDITRYFMTISEAAALVIQAGAMTGINKKSENFSPIYLLDMGKPIKIYDLAKLMIQLSGLTVFDKASGRGNIQINFIGIRPGEKLYEELLIGDSIGDTSHLKIKYANEEFLTWPKLNNHLLKIMRAINIRDQKTLMLSLNELVSGFKIEQK